MVICLSRISAPIAGLLFLVPALTLWAQILPQVTARIIIEGSKGAEVYLDEERLGVIPGAGSLVVPNVPPGPHRLKVTLEGKRDFEQRLVAAAGEVTRIRAPLTDYVGTLELYTAQGATVEVDGRKAGTADDTGRMLIRDLKAGRRNLHIFREGYNERTEQVQISSDATLTITLELDAAVRPVAAPGTPPTFVQVRTVAGFHYNRVRSVVFSPDNKWVIAGNAGGDSYVIRIWEASTGREVRALYDDGSTVVYILCTRDLAWCASQHVQGAERTLRVWDPRTGRELRRIDEGDEDYFGLTSISPDGTRLVVNRRTNSDVGETTVLDTSTWRPLFKVSQGGGALSPDAGLLATGGAVIQFWDGLTGKKLPRSIKGRGDSVDFSPDGRWLAVLSKGQLQIWEVSTGRLGPRYEAGDHVFSSDGRLLVTNSSEVTIWDFASAKPIQKLGEGSAIAVSPNGDWIAVGGDLSVRLWQRRPATR